MKLSDLLVEDWVLPAVVGGDLHDVLDALTARIRPLEDGEGPPASAPEGPIGGNAETVRIDDEVVVVVDTLEVLHGRGMRLAVGMASEPFRVPEPAGGTARVALLVLTPGRPVGARQQLLPALARAFKSARGAGSEVPGNPTERVEFLRRVLGVEFRPRLLVEDAVVPVQYRVYPSTPFGEVIDLMVRREVHAIPVVGEGYEVLGILTTGDALEDILRRGRPGDGEQGSRRRSEELTARDFMKRSVLCVSEDQALIDAANMMVNRDVEQLPVVRDGELVGFVTRKSILRAMHRTLEPDNEQDAERESES